MKKFFLLVVLLSSWSWAGGTMQLTGKLRSLLDKSFEVADDQNVYVISKEKIGRSNLEMLKKTKVGEEVTMWISFDAVDSVKTNKNKSL